MTEEHLRFVAPLPDGVGLAWEVFRITATPAAYLRRIYAKDKTAALKVAIEQFDILERFRDSLLARRAA